MRRPGLTLHGLTLHGPTLIATIAAIALAGCGKPAAPAETAAAKPPAAAPPSAEQMKAIQATLPAPYATADLDNGAAKFALCSSCHTLSDGGPTMTGPNLYKIIGEKAGVRPGFKFSEPMKAAAFTWDAAHLDTWIADPKAMVPGTKMTFAGLKDPKDRTDVIAYLMVQTGYRP